MSRGVCCSRGSLCDRRFSPIVKYQVTNAKAECYRTSPREDSWLNAGTVNKYYDYLRQTRGNLLKVPCAYYQPIAKSGLRESTSDL